MAQHVARHIARSLFCMLVLLLAWGPAAHAELLRLTQAQTTVFANGKSVASGTDLPYNWDIRNAGQHGAAVFDLHFEVAELPVEPWGVYLPSVGNAYDVLLNDTLLQRQGDLANPNGADYSKVPRFVVISPNLLQHSNVLRIHIRVDAERRGGLSEVYVGPQQEALSVYQHSYNWRGNGSLVVVAFSLAVGLLALGLWATQIDLLHPDKPRRDALYLFAALAELCWTLAVGDALIETPPLPWPWWSAVPAAGAAAWACNIQLFSIEVAGWRTLPFVTWFRRWLIFLIALSAVLPLWAAGWEQPAALTAWHVALAATFLGFGARFLWSALGPANWAHRLVAAALLLNLLVGIWDLCNFRIFPDFPDNSLLRFSSLFFGISLGCIVIMRFRTASRGASSLMNTLSASIAAKERDLRATYERLEVQAREQERIAERGRVLRDMHDGVGAHITLAIRQLQSDMANHAPSEHGEVLHTLRDALDHLKLTIDAINLPPGDITALLANLRYRLEPRMAASGIALVWDVDLLQVENQLESQAMRHLQFMLYEALSNVVQHAKATVLRIEAHAQPLGPDPTQHCIFIRVVDDGQGFDAQGMRRKGLASMFVRASAIGAQLSIESQPGCTVVQIQLAYSDGVA
jgi:signal transduction histidine kinase